MSHSTLTDLWLQLLHTLRATETSLHFHEMPAFSPFSVPLPELTISQTRHTTCYESAQMSLYKRSSLNHSPQCHSYFNLSPDTLHICLYPSLMYFITFHTLCPQRSSGWCLTSAHWLIIMTDNTGRGAYHSRFEQYNMGFLTISKM